MDLSTIEHQLTTAIGQQETSSGTTGVGVSLNNPTALKFAPWEAVQFGASPSPSGFASFSSLQSGWQAGLARVTQLVTGGASVTSLIDTWSPASDGNSNNASRVSAITSTTGLNATTPITQQVAAGVTPPATGTGTGITGTIANGVANALLPGFASISWGRIGALLIGVICLIIGLVSLKQTQIVVQSVTDKAKKVSKFTSAAA